ncbi:hypothetical protein PG994_006980 [Apiospora phragmitis]|uniref:Uncharacterized protein n=1 Tax=Apiospora phragmitis TaxID=2905665 RepID=A0ABR1V096_9PEZI
MVAHVGEDKQPSLLADEVLNWIASWRFTVIAAGSASESELAQSIPLGNPGSHKVSVSTYKTMGTCPSMDDSRSGFIRLEETVDVQLTSRRNNRAGMFGLGAASALFELPARLQNKDDLSRRAQNLHVLVVHREIYVHSAAE